MGLFSSKKTAVTMTCPECGDIVVNRTPWNDRTPYAAHGLPRPSWAHHDGTALCPVIGPGGYRPANPTRG